MTAVSIRIQTQQPLLYDQEAIINLPFRKEVSHKFSEIILGTLTDEQKKIEAAQSHEEILAPAPY